MNAAWLDFAHKKSMKHHTVAVSPIAAPAK